METVTFNIGLENNPMTVQNIKAIFLIVFPEVEFQLHLSEYLKNKEKTLVVHFQSTKKTKWFVLFTKFLCGVMSQESISFVKGNDKKLVFNTNYEGEKFEFDGQYFRNYVTEDELKEKYNLTAPFKDIRFDEHKRPYHKNEGLWYLPFKNKTYYTMSS